MVQQDGYRQRQHIELLCGGRPSFLVASAIRDVVTSHDASCNIIHIDRKEEEGKHGKEDRFVELAWGRVQHSRIRDDSGLADRFGKNRIRDVLQRFPVGNVPLDDPLAVRLAADSIKDTVKNELFRHLRPRVREGSASYIAVSLVPEGPTGTGVGWALLDWLPEWQDEIKQEYEAAGIPLNEGFKFFLLEFVPANPEDDDGNLGNLIQGYMTRKRLHQRHWPYYWFRFDGGKLKTQLLPISNSQASLIGAQVMGLVLTSRLVPPTSVRTQGELA